MYSGGIRPRHSSLKFDNSRSKKFSLNVYSSKFLVSTKPTLAQTLEKGDKLILNSEILRYSDRFIDDFAENGRPLIFQLVHAGSKRATHAGVLEFSGTESGVVYAPSWMMANIGADEGAPVFLRLCTLPKISFLHLVPLDPTFYEAFQDPKVMLEESLRSHTAVTLGDNLVVTLETGDRYGFLVHKIRPVDKFEACSLVGADVSLVIGDLDAEEEAIADLNDDNSRHFLVDGDTSFDADLHRAIAASLEHVGASSSTPATGSPPLGSLSSNGLPTTSMSSVGDFTPMTSLSSDDTPPPPISTSASALHTPGIYTADPSISPDTDLDALFEAGMFDASEIGRSRGTTTQSHADDNGDNALSTVASGPGVYRPLSQQLSESSALHTPRATLESREPPTRTLQAASSPPSHLPNTSSSSASPSIRPSTQPPVSLLRSINNPNASGLPPPSPGLAGASPVLQASRGTPSATPPMHTRDPSTSSPYLGGAMSPFVHGANENMKLEPSQPASGLLFEDQSAVYTFVFKTSPALPTVRFSLKSNSVDDVMKCSEIKGYPLPPPPSRPRHLSSNVPYNSPYTPSPLMTPSYTALPNLSLLSAPRSSFYEALPTDTPISKDRDKSDVDDNVDDDTNKDEKEDNEDKKSRDDSVAIPASADLYVSPNITRPTRYYFSVAENSTSTDKTLVISPDSRYYPHASVTGTHILYVAVNAYGDDIEYTLVAEVLTDDITKDATPDTVVADPGSMLAQKSPLSVHSLATSSKDTHSPTHVGSSGASVDAYDSIVSLGPDEGMCQTCGTVVNKARLVMHEAYCARNNYKCTICNKIMQKAKKDEHNHCPFHPLCSYIATSESGVQKHRKLTHDPFPCELRCGEDVLLENYHDHRKTFCVNRRETCMYCKLQLPHRLLDEHQEKCGSRTVRCASCNKYIMKKRFAQHEQSNCELTDTPFLAAQSESSTSAVQGFRDFALDRESPASSRSSRSLVSTVSSDLAAAGQSHQASPTESPRSDESSISSDMGISASNLATESEDPAESHSPITSRDESNSASSVEDTTHRTFTCPTCKLVLPPASYIDDLQMHVLFQCPKRGKSVHAENVRSLFGEVAVSAIDVLSDSGTSEDEDLSPQFPFTSLLAAHDNTSDTVDDSPGHLPPRELIDELEGGYAFDALSGDEDFAYIYDSDDIAADFPIGRDGDIIDVIEEEEEEEVSGTTDTSASLTSAPSTNSSGSEVSLQTDNASVASS